jgi:hypothetical protein
MLWPEIDETRRTESRVRAQGGVARRDKVRAEEREPAGRTLVNDNAPTDEGNRGSSRDGENEYGLKRLGQCAGTSRQQYGEGGNPHGIHKAHAVNGNASRTTRVLLPAFFDPRS